MIAPPSVLDKVELECQARDMQRVVGPARDKPSLAVIAWREGGALVAAHFGRGHDASFAPVLRLDFASHDGAFAPVLRLRDDGLAIDDAEAREPAISRDPEIAGDRHEEREREAEVIGGIARDERDHRAANDRQT